MRLRREMKRIKRDRRALEAWRVANMQEEVDDYGLQGVREETGSVPGQPREGGGPVERKQQ